jgi:hypothetical protein
LKLERFDTASDACRRLAAIHRREGRMKDAGEADRLAAFYRDDNPALWRERGERAAQAGVHRAAISAFGRALRLDPSDSTSQTAVGRAFRRLGEGESVHLVYQVLARGASIEAAAFHQECVVPFERGTARVLDFGDARGLGTLLARDARPELPSTATSSTSAA